MTQQHLTQGHSIKIGDIFRLNGKLFMVTIFKGGDGFLAEETPRPKYSVVVQTKFDYWMNYEVLPGLRPPTVTEARLQHEGNGYWMWYNGRQEVEVFRSLDLALARLGDWLNPTVKHARYEATVLDVVNQSFGSLRDNPYGPDTLLRGLGLDPLMTLAELRRILNEGMS